MFKNISNYFLKHKEIQIACFVFLFFYFICLLSPISGDDWGNYLIGTRGLKGWVGHAIGMYFNWEGRFLSRLLINLFTYNKWLWNIFNASLFAMLYLLTIKIIKPKRLILTSCILILGLLLIGNNIFTQTYLWIAGNLTYFVPLVLIMLYLYLINKYLEKNKKWYIYFIWITLNLIVPMFVENMGIVIILINLILIIYLLFKNKLLNKLLLISLLISIAAFLTMLLSPGTAFRMSYEATAFQNMHLIQKIITNVPNFIKFTFINNVFLMILMSISFVYLTCQSIKIKIFKIALLIIGILPIIIIFFNLFEINTFTIIYWIIYMISFITLIVKTFKQRPKVIFLLLVGLIGNGVMLMSPVWGPRTALFTVYFLIIVNLFVLNKIALKEKTIKKLIIVSKTIILIIMTLYVILYYNVYRQNNNRLIDINKQLKDNKQVIEIEAMPDYANCNIDPIADYHVRTFKKYYKIPENKEILLKETKYQYYIFYTK